MTPPLRTPALAPRTHGFGPVRRAAGFFAGSLKAVREPENVAGPSQNASVRR